MALKRLVLLVILLTCSQCLSETTNYTVISDFQIYEPFLRDKLEDVLVCEGNSAKFIDYLTKNTQFATEDMSWILPMLDATPLFSIPPGILSFNVYEFGEFDECMSIGSESMPNNAGIKGQYCTFSLVIKIKELSLSKSICIPHNCKLIPSNITINDNVHLTVTSMCQTKESNQLDWDDWTVIGVIIGILTIIAISTIYELHLRYTENKTKSPLFLAFSLVTNCEKLFSTSNSPGQIHCLHGIRTISMMWIIAGHRFVTISWLPTINFKAMQEFKDGYSSSYITSARAAVDTFFLFSAFLVSFLYFKGLRNAISKAETKGVKPQNTLTLAKIPMYYFHRLFRILPVLTAVYFVNLTLMENIGDGPIKPLSAANVATCSKWWWSYFLFVQNYVNYKDMCIVPTWYISADMQLFLLSPLLIIPLGELIIKGKKKTAYIVNVVVIWIAIVVPMAIEFFREFDKDNIYETHHRTSVYTIGILFGLIVVDCTDKKVKINHAVNMLLWTLSLCLMLAIVLTMHYTEIDATLEKNNLFFAISRPVWSAGLCWIVFSCHFGYGGIVNWFLSWPIFQVMTKLSFSMYLLHNLLIMISMTGIKYTRYFSQYSVIYEWCGDYFMTMLASIVCVLCFESPIVCIEKIMFATGKREKFPKQTDNSPQVKSAAQLA